MLHRLYEFKPSCKDHESINCQLLLNNLDWDKISCLVNYNNKYYNQNITVFNYNNCNIQVNSLEPAYIATKRLKKKDLTLGNFFGIWHQTKSKFNQINASLSNSIVESMNTRQEQLMDNSIFVAGEIISNYLLFV